MSPIRLLALLGCLAAFALPGGAVEESNVWPVRVAQHDNDGKVTAWNSLGPLFFSHPTPDGGKVVGFRPVYVVHKDAHNLTTEGDFFYPVFIYRADSETYRWILLYFITYSHPRPESYLAQGDQTRSFDVWPFYFSRQTNSPETSYRALFPVVGTIKNRFQYDQLSWVVWPLYFRSEKNGTVTTSTPWPFIKVTRGTDQGVTLWPVAGWSTLHDGSKRNFFLWPLGWNNTLQPPEDAPPGTAPIHQVGLLPFFTKETGPELSNTDFLWPFFGETTRTAPVHYHEVRYLWPLFVQGRGDVRMVNRWAPIYTHSLFKGTDKTWYLWPLVRKTKWTEGKAANDKTQILYLVYWNLEQRSLTNPNAAPANRTHLWPFFSHWDNGAGHTQFQLFSPFDVFWPHNQQVRESWTPLFAIYRSDHTPASSRWSLLWNAVTWRQEGGDREFHLGPLFSTHTQPNRKRVSVLCGLFGWQSGPAGGDSHMFWFDFSSKPTKVTTASAP